MSRTTYFTTRCPWGCEIWLHPKASVFDHRERCRVHPWVDDLPEVAVIPWDHTEVITAAVDQCLLGTVSLRDERWTNWNQRRWTRGAPIPVGGITLQTPIDGVPPRRWLTVALAAYDRYGNEGLARALNPADFHALEHEVLVPDAFVDCPCCGVFVAARSLKNHQRTNNACQWRRAAAEVRTAWAAGCRDPFSVPDAPRWWSELQARAVWRRRVRTVEFPTCTAVLLAPAP